MNSQTTRILLIAMLAVLAGVMGCSSERSDILGPDLSNKAPDGTDLSRSASELDIVDTAIGAGAFGTLVAAVQAAELEDALRSEGPFTVFAPSDDAFAALPDGYVEALLAPRNFEKLQELLLYHVVAGEVTSDQLRRYQFTETLSEKYLWIRKFWGRVFVNNARVTTADIEASNGVIHVINKVLVPRGFELVPEEVTPELDIVDTAIGAGAFETLVAAAGAAELVDALRGDGPLTVFAPTDDAFAKLPSGLVAALLLPENQGKLQELLLYHVVQGRVLSSDLRYYQRVPTLQGDEVRIIKWFGNVWVNWSRVTTADVLATNGAIHVINRVLIPRGFSLDDGSKRFDAESIDSMMTRRSNEELPPTEFELKYLEPAR